MPLPGMKMQGQAPTLYPSEDEFQDMRSYVQFHASMAEEFGMIKVVPPESWQARTSGYEGLDSLIRRSGRQTSEGDDGVYSLTVEECGSVYISDFVKYAQVPGGDHQQIDFWSCVGSDDGQDVYTAHSPNASLFDKDLLAWNLRQFLGRGRPSRGWQVSSQGTNGVHLGMRNTARGWLREDAPSFGAAFLHFGEKRTVYSVPASHQARVEEILNEMLPDKAQATQGRPLTREHALLLDPAVLSKRGVPVAKVVQGPGEFVVHFSGAYHSSFCHGLSCWEYASSAETPLPDNTQYCAAAPSSFCAAPLDNLEKLAAVAAIVDHDSQAENCSVLPGFPPSPQALDNLLPSVNGPPHHEPLEHRKRGVAYSLDFDGAHSTAPQRSSAASTTSHAAAPKDETLRDNINQGGQGIRRKRKRKAMDASPEAGVGSEGQSVEVKNKNCHFCEHAPKRCSIFACTDSVCDQLFCENCCKRHLGKPTHFKGQDDADACNWRCPICTRQCCCTLAVCNRQHLHCKRYRRRTKQGLRKGGTMGSENLGGGDGDSDSADRGPEGDGDGDGQGSGGGGEWTFQMGLDGMASNLNNTKYSVLSAPSIFVPQPAQFLPSNILSAMPPFLGNGFMGSMGIGRMVQAVVPLLPSPGPMMMPDVALMLLQEGLPPKLDVRVMA